MAKKPTKTKTKRAKSTKPVKARNAGQYGTKDIPALIGKNVRFQAGSLNTEFTGEVICAHGNLIEVRSSDGTNRKTYPSSCTII